MSDNKVKRGDNKKIWMLCHPKYKEVVLLCEKHKWQERATLPRAGGRSQGAIELDNIVKAGLDGNQQPFSRNQLN